MTQFTSPTIQCGKLTSLNPGFENISLSKNPSGSIVFSEFLEDSSEENGPQTGYKCQIYQEKEDFFIHYTGSNLSVQIEGQDLKEGEVFKIKSGEKIALIVNKEQEDEVRMEYVFSSELIETEKEALKRDRERNEESGTLEKKMKFSQNLESGLSCKICKKMICECVSVVPCLHRFCMNCLMQHLKGSQECPQCGERFVNFCRDTFLTNIIEAYEESEHQKERLQEEFQEISQRLFARFEYANGDVYEGEWRKCRRDGRGKMMFNNGDVYEGDWKEDVREGHGRLIYKNGDFYDGEFKNNEREGKGKMSYKMGHIYEGDWKHNHKEGQGIIVYTNGDVYEGEWANDQIEGEGKMVFMIGCMYEGHWESNYITGKGKMLYPNGNIYDGEWKETQREGKGKMLYANGDVYEGNWEQNKREGEGTMVYENGDVYEGQWINDREDRDGKLSKSDCSEECQIWTDVSQDDELIIIE